MNCVFSEMAAKSTEVDEKEKGQIGENTDLSLAVAGTGLEPMTFGL